MDVSFFDPKSFRQLFNKYLNRHEQIENPPFSHQKNFGIYETATCEISSTVHAAVPFESLSLLHHFRPPSRLLVVDPGQKVVLSRRTDDQVGQLFECFEFSLLPLLVKFLIWWFQFGTTKTVYLKSETLKVFEHTCLLLSYHAGDETSILEIVRVFDQLRCIDHLEGNV